jgi:ABC-type transport system involved in cytochrome c biogenesis permease subunit
LGILLTNGFGFSRSTLSPNISDRIQPLLPALKSNWLIAHVIACFIGYAAFAIAWRGSKIAYFSIFGFGAVLFTYFGVNYLPGLHSYGSV